MFSNRKDLYHCDKILQCTLENGNYPFTKEEAFITGVSAVVGAAEKVLLLWWTQFKCTIMHIVGSAMTAQSSLNLLFLLIIVPDVILEAPDVSL